MTFDIKQLYPVVNHLQQTSNVFKEIGNEIQIYCPYCDDMNRGKGATNHGHLYLSINHPVFHCQRCKVSGTLFSLLVFTGFDDTEILKYIGSFIKYGFKTDYFRTHKKSAIDPRKAVLNHELRFRKEYRDEYDMYTKYINKRTGITNGTYFLIYPGFFEDKMGIRNLVCSCMNYEGDIVTHRLINNNSKMRYHITSNNVLYHFQEKNFEKYKQIVIAEGMFDIINLALYSNIFSLDECFFITSRTSYVNVIERLIMEEYISGNYEFNIVFDNDVKHTDSLLYKSRLIATQFNSEIEIRGWSPIIGKDPGDYPVLREV